MLKKKIILSSILVLFNILISFSQNQDTKIKYTLEMSQPQTHYFEVTMKINQVKSISQNGYIDVKMPVWTPGSYLIREYAKNVEGFGANSKGKSLKSQKINKNTWRIQTENVDEIELKYKVYAFELTVRNSFLDEAHGYLNGASIFMYVPQFKNEPSTITVKPYQKWEKVSTALKRIDDKNFIFYAENYDLVVDSPFEIGNHQILKFETMGVPHEIAMFSVAPLQYDEAKVIETYKKVVQAAGSVVNDKHPCQNYLFIIHHQPGIGGGLEHLNSTTCQTGLGAYTSDGAFKGFFSLIAHEYFHLWNVKRIRPIALGPFDYDNENYTSMLWVSEGFTSFYQEYILLRAGILNPEEYINKYVGSINNIENQAGNQVQSISESSFDAWIKYYRPNENSQNSTISYYTKGAVIGGLLNLYIIGETDGKKNLDDVYRILWNDYYKKLNRGFTDEEFKATCEKVAGKKLDDFFEKYINGTESIDYNKFFNIVGMQLIDENKDLNTPFIGANVAGGKVLNVLKGSPAYIYGINVNDEIVEVNGNKTNTLFGVTNDKKIGDKIKVTVRRSGELKTLELILARNPQVKYKLVKLENMNKKQEELYKKWVQIP